MLSYVLRNNKKQLLVLLFILLGNVCFATHAVGSDMRVTWVGPGPLDYEVQIVFYRDCAGSPAPGTMTFCYASSNCGINNSMAIGQDAGTGQEISPICPTQTTRCSGGTFMGVQEYTYTSTITLPSACDDWVFTTFLCCRNNAITNLNNPGGARINIRATLDNLNFPMNSTPYFANKPVPFICVGQPFTYNHGAQDPEGDNLQYSLINPRSGSNCTDNGVVTYNGLFSANSPLSSTPALTINQSTGDIQMTPTAQEITVMAVLVEEFKNGVLSGSVIRDIQVVVEVCNNELPTLTGMNGQNVFLDTVCAGKQICFDVNGADADVGQNLTVTWDQSIPGGNFTAGSGSTPISNFCWTPSLADTSSVPHYFTMTVEDDNCPYFGFNVYSYGILVTPGIDADLGGDQNIYCGDSIKIGVNSNQGGPFTYQWSNGSTSDSIMAVKGPYAITIDDGSGCLGQDSIFIDNIDKPTALFDYSAVCANSLSTFIDTSSFFNALQTWNWDFGDGNTGTGNNVSHTYQSAGNFTVQLHIIDNKGCEDSISKSVFVTDVPTADFIADTVCPNNLTSFTDLSSFSMVNITNWSWDFGDGIGSSTLQNPLYTYSSGGAYSVSLVVTNSKGCEDSLIKNIQVYQPPKAEGNGLDVCDGTAMAFNDLSSSLSSIVNSWTWNFGDPNSGASNVSSVQYPTHTYLTHGAYTVSLNVSDQNGCIGDTTFAVNVLQRPQADFSAQDVCLNEATSFTDASIAYVSNLASWEWTLEPAVSSTDQNPSHTYPTTGLHGVQMIVSDSKGCKDTIQKNINVLELPTVDFVGNLLAGCSPLVVSFTPISNDAVAWSWDLGDGSTSVGQTPSHTYSSVGTYDVSLTVTGTNGCSNSLLKGAMLEVYPNPVAAFTPTPTQGTLIDAIIDFNNQSMDGTNWYWQFGDGSSSTEEHPSYMYSDTGWHQVMLVASSINGCLDTTYSDVYIAPDFSIFFPNAFTPNGDLQNDDFGGIGVFEGIKEYDLLIYNRWGELVYRTDDPYQSWNGRKYNDQANPVSPDGAYAYIALVRDYLERKYEYKGMFILLSNQ